jgi:hypothetical protein
MEWVDIIKPPNSRSLPDGPTRQEVQLLINSVYRLRYRMYFFALYSMGLRSIGYQTAGSPVSFNATGNGTTNFTPLPTFPGFNPAAVPAGQLNPTLFGFHFFIQNVQLGGYLNVATFVPTSFTATPSIALGIDSINPTSSTNVEFTLMGNTITGIASGLQAYTISQTVAYANSPDIALPPPPGQYTVPNNVTTDYFSTAWTVTKTPSNLFTNLDSATITGAFGLQYVYTYVPDVPGPLPILGVGAGFGWTRRLRLRISKSA